MGKYFVEFEPLAKKKLKAHFEAVDQASIKKVTKILEELVETPYSGEGKSEELKCQLTGFWSRQINKKDRMIYKVEVVTVIIISAMSHYSDK